MYASRMVSRRWIYICLLSLVALISSSLVAGVIMTSDGKSTQCFFDPAQTLTFSTPQGETNLTMGDVVWLAGAGTNKARAKGSTSLVSGTLADVGITCYASAKDRDAGKGKTIQSGAAIFVYTDDVEVKKKRSLTIEEFAGGRIVTLKEVPAKDFFVYVEGGQSQNLAGGKLRIVDTVTNVNRLPISLRD